jgi:cyclophilin family peptidyl-prolyl cis-trans isomerase
VGRQVLEDRRARRRPPDGWILYRTNAKHTVRVEGDSNWSKLLAVAQEDSAKGVIAGPPAELRQVAEQLKGSPTAGWALYIGATSALADGKYDEAESLVKELQSTYPNHPLVTLKLRDAEGAATTTVTARLASRIAAERDWIAAHPSLFDNPPLPADAPKVRLTTDRGPIVVGLYTDLAPEHANNFLKLVREGFYVGTKFHSVFAGEYIQGGDPNTKDKDKDPNTWGQGGPDYTQERKKSALRHFTGVISAVPVPGELTKTSGSQFLITTSSVHGLDETYVPFGKGPRGPGRRQGDREVPRRGEHVQSSEGSGRDHRGRGALAVPRALRPRTFHVERSAGAPYSIRLAGAIAAHTRSSVARSK